MQTSILVNEQLVKCINYRLKKKAAISNGIIGKREIKVTIKVKRR